MLIPRIQKLLEKYDKKAWIMLNTENLDKFFCRYITDQLSTYTICLIAKDEAYLLVNRLDEKNISSLDFDSQNIYIYTSSEELEDILEEILDKVGFPDDISLSYSTIGDMNTDIISHGKYLAITNLVQKAYFKYHKKVKFTSAEEIIYDIATQKSDEDIQRLKLIASITDTILETTFKEIRVGMTEIAISNLTQNVANRIMKLYQGSNEIVDYDMAWENCPIVLTGENLSKGGHSIPSMKPLEYGDTIYFDFGLKVSFQDGKILYTDMQRMGYALKKEEKEPPLAVQKVFDTLVDAIEEGIEEMRPEVKGYEIDDIVRNRILSLGYPDYPHATGHPVGYEVHDIGAIISFRSGKRSRMGLVENGVYTLEPRINIANGGSIEEMILVTKFGGVPLCKMQKEIYIVS